MSPIMKNMVNLIVFVLAFVGSTSAAVRDEFDIKLTFLCPEGNWTVFDVTLYEKDFFSDDKVKSFPRPKPDESNGREKSFEFKGEIFGDGFFSKQYDFYVKIEHDCGGERTFKKDIGSCTVGGPCQIGPKYVVVRK